MTQPPRARAGEGSGIYLAVTVLALIVVVYLAFQLIGFLFKLAFLVVAALIALAAWRAWSERP
jgi:hypothetical protein